MNTLKHSTKAIALHAAADAIMGNDGYQVKGWEAKNKACCPLNYQRIYPAEVYETDKDVETPHKVVLMSPRVFYYHLTLN